MNINEIGFWDMWPFFAYGLAVGFTLSLFVWCLIGYYARVLRAPIDAI